VTGDNEGWRVGSSGSTSNQGGTTERESLRPWEGDEGFLVWWQVAENGRSHRSRIGQRLNVSKAYASPFPLLRPCETTILSNL
jgi:hypothetical protein